MNGPLLWQKGEESAVNLEKTNLMATEGRFQSLTKLQSINDKKKQQIYLVVYWLTIANYKKNIAFILLPSLVPLAYCYQPVNVITLVGPNVITLSGSYCISKYYLPLLAEKYLLRSGMDVWKIDSFVGLRLQDRPEKDEKQPRIICIRGNPVILLLLQMLPRTR